MRSTTTHSLSDEHSARLLAEHLIDGGLVIRGTIVDYANHSATSLLGVDREQLAGEDVGRWLPLGAKESAREWLADRSGEVNEETLSRSDGSTFPARVGVRALGPDDVFVLTIQDISEARALAEMLDAELVSLEARRTDMLATKQATIQALSLPILHVWEGVITVPLLGLLDEARAAETVERLLDEVVRGSIRYVILDLTGLETVDLGSARYLASMIRTLSLVGSGAVVAGIRPELSRKLIEEGISLAAVPCFSTQAQALTEVLARLGWSVTRRGSSHGQGSART